MSVVTAFLVSVFCVSRSQNFRNVDDGSMLLVVHSSLAVTSHLIPWPWDLAYLRGGENWYCLQRKHGHAVFLTSWISAIVVKPSFLALLHSLNGTEHAKVHHGLAREGQGGGITRFPLRRFPQFSLAANATTVALPAQVSMDLVL